MTFKLQFPNRRWFRFSLRVMLLLVTVFAIWFGVSVNRAKKQKAAREALTKIGCRGVFDYMYSNDGSRDFSKTSNVPSWLLDFAGYDFFHNVKLIEINYGEFGPAIIKSFENAPEIKDHILRFPNLESLSVMYQQATDELLENLPKMRSLRHFRMTMNFQLTARGLSHLKEIPHLESFSLSAPLTDEQFREISQMQQINTLYINLIEFSDQTVSGLKNLKNLNTLYITLERDAPEQSAQRLLEIVKTMPNLKHLHFYAPSFTLSSELKEQIHKIAPKLKIN